MLLKISQLLGEIFKTELYHQDPATKITKYYADTPVLPIIENKTV